MYCGLRASRGSVNFVSAHAAHAVKLKNWKEYGCE